MEYFVSAFLVLLSGWHLLYLLIGVVLGLLVGILPGLGGVAGMSILIPFVYGMDPVSALAMLIGLAAVIQTGDTFTSVLMGIPGSSASQATILDGFPLAKRGQAAYALSAAFSSSMIGGVFGALVLTGFIFVARPVILSFSSAELFMLTVLGLSMVGVLSGSSMVKGLVSCGLGLLLGCVGPAPATGEYRLNLGTAYLTDPIPVVIVGLGIFAIPEIVDLLRLHGAIAQVESLGQGWLRGLRDTLKHWWIVLRCSGIGCLIGALPGLGGSVAEWVVYGHVIQTSRNKSEFGKGDIRGVIAPECANNAVLGGALVPTLLFGIPGTSTMAILLGAMILLGIQPGITMVEARLDVTYTIIWSVAIANLVGAGICVFISKPIALLTSIRYAYLAPFMVMVIFFSAYQANSSWGDLILLFLTGCFAVYMKRFGWSRPAFLIGFVLAPGAETYLYQAIQFYGWQWLARPGTLIIVGLTAASLWAGTLLGRASRFDEGGKSSINIHRRRPQVFFCVGVIVMLAYGFIDSLKWSFLGKIFPLAISTTTILFVSYLLLIILTRRTSHSAIFDIDGDRATFTFDPRTPEYYLTWLVGLMIMIYLLGFMLAFALFFILFLFYIARATIRNVTILTACAMAFLLTVSYIFHLDLPEGLIHEALRNF